MSNGISETCPFWRRYNEKQKQVHCEGYFSEKCRISITFHTQQEFIINKKMRCQGDFTKCPYWMLTMERYGGSKAFPFKSGISEYNVGAEVDMGRYK